MGNGMSQMEGVVPGAESNGDPTSQPTSGTADDEALLRSARPAATGLFSNDSDNTSAMAGRENNTSDYVRKAKSDDTTAKLEGVEVPVDTDTSEDGNRKQDFGRGLLQHGESDLPESCRAETAKFGRYHEEEVRVQKHAKHGKLWLAIVNGYSAVMVFVLHLVSLESLLAIALSVGFTVFTYFKTEDNESFDGGVLDWVLLSFAVITPLATSIGMAFNRRERGLAHIVAIRATMLELYSSHAAWDWRKAGKAESGRANSHVDWLQHSDTALVEILGICHTLSRFLLLPNATRARHRITPFGQTEARETQTLASKLYLCMLVRFGRLTDLCEIMKEEGLPPNEATRVRQWERMVLEHADGLRMIKVYRTPQALRSFARLFTVFLPPFYAPSFVEIARRVDSLGLAIAFSVLTSLALTALFETISQMEDPFMGYRSLDGIDVDSELSSSFSVQCLTMRCHFFPNSHRFDEARVNTSTCERLPVKEFKLTK